MPVRDRSSRATAVVLALAVAATLVAPALHFIPTATRVGSPLFGPRVCAFYYTWYGNETAYPGEHPGTKNMLLHWDENQPSFPSVIGSAHHPTLGTDGVVLYDSADPVAIRYHLDTAVAAGIDTFIATWWGSSGYTEDNFKLLLNETEHGDYPMQHSVYFESVQGRYNASALPAATVSANIAEDLEHIVTTHGNHPNFLRVFDAATSAWRPVIFVYAVTSLKKTGAIWSDAVAILHGKGLHPFLIGDMGNPGVASDVYRAFDGIHVYNPLGIYRDEPATALGRFETMVASARFGGKLAAATVLPGYNDTMVRDGVPVLPRQGGWVYDHSWDVAITANPDWVLICTWNEWHEGSEIETSLENGTYYVDATATHVARFKA